MKAIKASNAAIIKIAPAMVKKKSLYALAALRNRQRRARNQRYEQKTLGIYHGKPSTKCKTDIETANNKEMQESKEQEPHSMEFDYDDDAPFVEIAKDDNDDDVHNYDGVDSAALSIGAAADEEDDEQSNALGEPEGPESMISTHDEGSTEFSSENALPSTASKNRGTLYSPQRFLDMLKSSPIKPLLSIVTSAANYFFGDTTASAHESGGVLDLVSSSSSSSDGDDDEHEEEEDHDHDPDDDDDDDDARYEDIPNYFVKAKTFTGQISGGADGGPLYGTC